MGDMELAGCGSDAEAEAEALVGGAGPGEARARHLRPVIATAAMLLGALALLAGAGLALAGGGTATAAGVAAVPPAAVQELIVAAETVEQAVEPLPALAPQAAGTDGSPQLPCSSGCHKVVESKLALCKPGKLGCSKAAYHRHSRCLLQCTCSDECHSRLHSVLAQCRPGDAGCMKPAHHRHKHCCDGCPGSTC
uniref:Uncharacterized protein n=1 Tax=Alexandrium catenella TaxID=2925 RepID=A0A7S1RH59_ALECA